MITICEEELLLLDRFAREAFMEKHWKTVIGKSICDYFFEAQKTVKQLDYFCTNSIELVCSAPMPTMFHLWSRLHIIISFMYSEISFIFSLCWQLKVSDRVPEKQQSTMLRSRCAAVCDRVSSSNHRCLRRLLHWMHWEFVERELRDCLRGKRRTHRSAQHRISLS